MTDWKMTLGANIVGDGVEFAVWAPEHKQVSVFVADDHGDRKQKTDARPKPFFHSSFSFLFFCALHEYPFGSHC